jgi:hypothetical protein
MAASKKKAAQGAAVSNKITIPGKTKTMMSPSLKEVPGTRRPLTDVQKDSVIKSWQTGKKQTTRSYSGVSQSEGDSMLDAFKKRNPGMKSGGKIKKK